MKTKTKSIPKLSNDNRVRPYFDLQTVLDKYNIDYESDSCIVCINTIRNVGKTTSALNWLESRISHNSKVAFIRNNEEQLKTFKQDFNARYQGKFMISGNLVYSVIREEITDTENNDMVVYKRGEHIGYCGSISTYTKIKSIQAANIRYILMDEYNEADLTISNIYVKWINMVKTLSRFNKVFVLMLGNRDTPNNEFMVKWGVLPQTSLFHEDYYYKFSSRGHFIEMGSAQFDGLENDKTLVNELAQFDQHSKRYLEGGYAVQMVYQVVPFEKIIKKTFYPYFKLASRQKILAWGHFIHPRKGKCFALVEDSYALNMCNELNLETHSLDHYSYQLQDTKLNTTDSMLKEIMSLFRCYKRGALYFDSFDILTDITNKMESIKF